MSLEDVSVTWDSMLARLDLSRARTAPASRRQTEADVHHLAEMDIEALAGLGCAPASGHNLALNESTSAGVGNTVRGWNDV